MPLIPREESSGLNLIKQKESPITHTQSDPDILSTMETELSHEDIKIRQPKSKRIRLDSGTKKGEIKEIQDFRKEILEVLSTMK